MASSQQTLPTLERGPVQRAVSALRSDLIHEDGPRISTMRNYRFAIVPYDPRDEYKLRVEVQILSAELMASGWHVLPISLHQLLLDRIRAQGDDWVQRIIAREKGLVAMEQRLARAGNGTPPGKSRALNDLRSKISPLIEGPNGIAADCARIVAEHIERYPDTADRTVAFIGRAGALYPFFRSSALLRHLDGRTQNVNVVLLYPGERQGATGLSFMSQVAADSDYRPRIYP